MSGKKKIYQLILRWELFYFEQTTQDISCADLYGGHGRDPQNRLDGIKQPPILVLFPRRDIQYSYPHTNILRYDEHKDVELIMLRLLNILLTIQLDSLFWQVS